MSADEASVKQSSKPLQKTKTPVLGTVLRFFFCLSGQDFMMIGVYIFRVLRSVKEIRENLGMYILPRT